MSAPELNKSTPGPAGDTLPEHTSAPAGDAVDTGPTAGPGTTPAQQLGAQATATQQPGEPTRIPDPAEVFPELGRPTTFAGYIPPNLGAGSASYTPESFGQGPEQPYPAVAGAPQQYPPRPYGSPSPESRRLLRSRQDRWIGGVCGGLGEYFGWDPNLVRLAFALSILLPGPQFLVYLVLWVVIPRASA